MKKNISLITAALLGVLIGGLAVMAVYGASSKNSHRLSADPSNWSKLNLVLSAVDGNYVDTIDHEALSRKAIEAVLAGLDPHSIYLPPVELKESETELEGNFEGIGIQFNVPNDTAIVIEVIHGGPSEKVGLLPGDRLLKVDSIVIAGVKYHQDSMVRHIKGPAGSTVTVTVGRDGKVIPFEITRGRIPIYSVNAAFMADDTTGYIKLSSFARTTYDEVVKACNELMGEGMKRLIFDLRGNSGGYFDQSLRLANLFLPKDSMIVYLQGLHRTREDYRASGKGMLLDMPLTVLIDDGSASSSEIFAGAMQDNGRARIVGRRSFGKGLVQEPFYFSDGSGVRLTIARFHTPSGRCIQKPYSDDYNLEVYKRYGTGELLDADSMKVENGGIIPDVFVPLDTTSASKFLVDCRHKSTEMRFASAFFDSHKDELSGIDDYDELLEYLRNAGLESAFLNFALTRDGLKPAPGEWASEKIYIMESVYALVGRYSKLGDKAYYHIFLETDDAFHCAMKL